MATWLGGVCTVPIACRSKDSTMTMRRKEVVISKRLGRNVSEAMRISVCTLRV